ncbi:uncharacterized protein VNE69_11134 [Vairimorpha necatrix]|uniref:Uncharacterized protein n=1 Tax=Vairimorpha necatrix TaxID=6039 RepID=A0AAX4JGR1_9MICR
MIIFKMIAVFVFVKANKILFGNILRKIENRDYVSIDTMKEKTNVTVCASYSGLSIAFKILCFKNDLNFNIELERFHVYIEEKTSYRIIEEMEDKIKEVLYGIENFSIVFLYNIIDYKTNLKIHMLVEQLKKLNLFRRVKDKLFKICYANICGENDKLHSIVSEINQRTYESKSNMSRSSIHYSNNLLNNRCYVILRIEISNFLYFFEFHFDELYCLVETEINIQKKFNDQILEKYRVLFPGLYENLYFQNLRMQKIPINSTLKKIKIFCVKPFVIEIQEEKISFVYDIVEYCYCLENVSKKNVENIYINKICLEEFRTLLHSLHNMDNVDSIIIFYRLLQNSNKLGFFVEKIIRQPETALNILFAHFLLSNDTINRDAFNIIIGKKKEVDVKKTKLTKKITKKLENTYHTIEQYLMGICLLLEAEKYIDENDTEDDLLFQTLKDLWSVIEKNDNENWSTNSSKKNINLVKCLDLLIKIYNNKSNMSEKIISENLCNLVALFTDLSLIDIYNHPLKKNYKVEKAKIIKNFELNEIEITEYNKIIRKKLMNIEKEEYKNVADLKKLIRILQKSLLDKKLNFIVLEALVCFLTKEYNYETKNKLKKEARILVETTFNDFLLELLSANINIDVINGYMGSLMDALLLDFNKYDPGFVRKISFKFFNQVIIEKFRSEFCDDMNEKSKWDVTFQKLKKMLNYKGNLHSDKDIPQITNDIIKILESQ